MAAKGTKRGRGRAKGSEPETEPTTSPEAPLPPEEAVAEGESDAGAETPPSPEPETPGAASEPVEPQQPTKPVEAWSASHLAVAGLAIILVAALVAGAVFFARTGDTGRIDQQAQRLDALAMQTRDQTSRIDAAEEAISGLQAEVGQVTAAVNDLQSTAEANRQNLEQMTQAIEGLRGAVDVPADGVAGEAVGELQDTVQALDQRLASLEQGAGLEDLTGRIARLEEEISGIREQAAERVAQAETETALGRAYAALTERIAAGEPFAEELDAVTAELPSAPGLELLRPIADEGAPTVSALQARLDEIAGGPPSQENGDAADGDGLWQTMSERLEGMVTVRRADEADLPAALERAREALRRDDLEGAIAEIEPVSGAAPGEIESWLADARARRDAQAGLNQLSDAVLRQFAGRQ